MFDYFISLGWYCGIAASMEKLGLRSQSGPFDWCYSDFRGVVQCIENKFADVLDYKNLQVIEDKPLEFEDTKYNFYYNHELHGADTLDDSYSDI